MVKQMAMTLAIAGAMVAGAATASANLLTLTETSAWGSDDTLGPFEVQPSFGGNPFLGQNGAAPGNFITFCLERNEDAGEGVTYNVSLSTAAKNGGQGGGNPDPLDERTAFLYTKFSEGTLDDSFNAWTTSQFTFTYLEAFSGESLQDAIWVIEDEKPFFRDDKNPAEVAFRNELIAFADQAVAFGGEWFGMGIGNVRVMNLTKLDGTNAQDMLTIVPLPMPVALGLVGLVGVAAASRRRKNGELAV